MDEKEANEELTPYEEDEEVKLPSFGKRVARCAIVVASTVGILTVPVLCMMTPTMGATRSARLQWQQRQKIIAQVMAEELAAEDNPVRAVSLDQSLEQDR